MEHLHGPVALEGGRKNLDFCNALFAAEPFTLQHGYAKWRPEGPCVNFARSSGGLSASQEDSGIQVEAGCCTRRAPPAKTSTGNRTPTARS